MIGAEIRYAVQIAVGRSAGLRGAIRPELIRA